MQGHVDGVVRQTFLAVAAGDLVADHGADRTVDVANRHFDAHGLLAFEGRSGKFDELVVQRLLQLVVLLDGLVQDRAGYRTSLLEHVGQVDAAGLPALDGLVLIQALNVADGLLKSPEAELGENLAHLLSDEHEEVDHMLRLATETSAQLRILGGNALRAGVLLAGAHHDAAFHDQGCGSEAEFLGTKQGGDDHVTTGLELAVALDDDAGAQTVQD